LVSHIPGVRRRPAGIGRGGQIAIQIVRLGSGPECGLLVVRIVVGRRQLAGFVTRLHEE
jgi:hypothetical protein